MTHLFNLRPARRAVSRPVCADETNPALSVDRKLRGASTVGPHTAQPAPAVAPHDPPRSADACRSAIGRPILYVMSPITKSLIEELEHAPESVQREVLAFLRHLRARGAGSDGSEDVQALLPLAESAWAVDWDTPEEDEAWRNL